jgi:hypothetical protein
MSTFANRQARTVPPSPADPKPVLAVKPLMRDSQFSSRHVGPYRSATKGPNPTGALEPGEVRPEDLPFMGSAAGLPAGNVSRLRAYRRPSLVSNREPGEILPHCLPLEPGEIRPGLSGPEPGEILPTASGPGAAYEQRGLEPGEIPTETTEHVFCFDQAATSRHDEHQRTIFVENTSRGQVKALASIAPTVPLHNIAIASPVLVPRKLLPSALNISPLIPPQRQFSVIQGPQKRISPAVKPVFRTEVLDNSPVVSSQSGAVANICSSQPVAVIHQHLTITSPVHISEPSCSGHQKEDVFVPESVVLSAVNTTNNTGSKNDGDVTEHDEHDNETMIVEPVEISSDSSSGKSPETVLPSQPSSSVSKKRRRGASGAVIPIKKRRSMQEYPVSLGIIRNKVSQSRLLIFENL